MTRSNLPPRAFRPGRAAAAVLLATALASAAAAGGGASGPVAGPQAPPPKIDRFGDQVAVFSGDLHVPADVRLRGSVVCIGGHALVEGEVTGDVVVILGSLEMTGRTESTVTGVMSNLTLEGGTVERELVNVLGTLTVDGTRVESDLVNILGSLRRSGDSDVGGDLVNIGFGSWLPGLTGLMFWLRLFFKLLVFLLVLLLVAVVPDRIRAIGEEAPARYATAFFVGLLGYLGLLVVLGVLSVTFFGVFPAFLAFYVFRWLGIAGVFYAIGRRIGRAIGREPSVPGAVLLVFALYVVATLAPTPLGLAGLAASSLLWVVFFLLVDLPAVGLVILTRAGSAPPAPPPAAAALAAPPGPPTGPDPAAGSPHQR